MRRRLEPLAPAGSCHTCMLVLRDAVIELVLASSPLPTRRPVRVVDEKLVSAISAPTAPTAASSTVAPAAR
jgi:hypothetical protein